MNKEKNLDNQEIINEKVEPEKVSQAIPFRNEVLDKEIPVRFWTQALGDKLKDVKDFVEAFGVARNSADFQEGVLKELKSRRLDSKDPIVIEIFESTNPVETAGQVQNLLGLLFGQLTTAENTLETTGDLSQLDTQIVDLLKDDTVKLFRNSILRGIISSGTIEQGGANENSTTQFINKIILDQERSREEEWQKAREARKSIYQEIRDFSRDRRRRQTIERGLLEGASALSEEDLAIQRVIEKLRRNPEILNGLDDHTKEQLQDALRRILIIRPLQEELRQTTEEAGASWSYLRTKLAEGAISPVETVRRLLIPMDQWKSKDLHVLVTLAVDKFFKPDEPIPDAFTAVIAKLHDMKYLAGEIEEWQKADIYQLHKDEISVDKEVGIEHLYYAPVQGEENIRQVLNYVRLRMKELLISEGSQSEEVENEIMELNDLYKRLQFSLTTGKPVNTKAELRRIKRPKKERNPKSNIEKLQKAAKSLDQTGKEKKYPPVATSEESRKLKQNIIDAGQVGFSLKPRNQGVTHRKQKASAQ